MARARRTPPIPPDAEAVIRRLETRGPVRTRAMFGGHGVWCVGRFVAVVFAGSLYLKADAATRPLFEAAGCPAFRPFEGRPSSMSFYRLPAEATAGSDALDVWLERAVSAAR